MTESEERAGPQATKTPLLRNPWVWGFLIGIVALTALRPFLRRIPEPPPVVGRLPAWTLVDADGRSFGSADLNGRVWVASFFFTRCPSICPAIMRGMSRLQAGFDERGIDGIHLVSISVDPEHDRGEVLRDYAKGLGVRPQRWTLVTGEPEGIRRLVVEGFKLPLGERTEGPATPMDIAHGGKLVIVDGSGGIRGYYDTDELGLDEVYNRARHVRDQERGEAR